MVVAFLPLAGVVAEAEWVHQAFVVAALPFSAWAIIRSNQMKGRVAFVLLAVSGLALLVLVAGAFVEALHDFETLLTVVGVLLLASSHICRGGKTGAICLNTFTNHDERANAQG